jgi:phytoene dehydrogenase-like protein
MPMLKTMYDLIIIGDDLSSHVSAAYASQNGLHTLLIAEGGLGGLQLIGDFVFNIDPTPITGLGPDQLGLSVLTELGIAPPEAQAASINPAFQVILPDHRIDFYNDPGSLTSELTREFPELDQDISDYYNIAFDASSVFNDWITEHPQIQPQNLKEYFAYLKIFFYIVRYKFGAVKFDKILSQDASLEKVWEAQQALLSGNLDDLFSFASAFQYCAPLRGVSYFPQGKQFLFNALVEKLESSNGLYLNNYQVASIARNKTIDLEIKAPDGTISKVSGHHLIVSTKSDKLSLLLGNHKHINFSDWLRPAKIAYYPFTIFLGVAETCLPEQIARHIAVVTDVTKDIYDNNLIILETSLPEKGKSLSPARTSLTATVYLPDMKENWTGDALQREANSILERLEVFLPFLKDNIELNNIAKSIDISMQYRKVLNPKYKVHNALFTSFAAKSNKTRFNNVFLTGASLLTDAGFDAEIISGKNAALQVMKKRK